MVRAIPTSSNQEHQSKHIEKEQNQQKHYL